MIISSERYRRLKRTEELVRHVAAEVTEADATPTFDERPFCCVQFKQRPGVDGTTVHVAQLRFSDRRDEVVETGACPTQIAALGELLAYLLRR